MVLFILSNRLSIMNLSLWFHDFLASSEVSAISLFFGLDILSGTVIAVKNRVWTSQNFGRAFTKLIKWFFVALASHVAITSNIPQIVVMGHSLWAGACIENFGSTMENIGLIDNDKTQLKCGKDITPTVTVQIEEGPKSV